jgi:hypothetical protein
LLGEFVAGVGYPVADPAFALNLLALGCLIGQAFPRDTAAPIGRFALSTAAGIAAVHFGWAGEERHVLSLLAALAAAAGAMAAPRLVRQAPAALVAAAGFLAGAAATPASLPLSLVLPALIGALAGATIVLSALAFVSRRFRRKFGGDNGWVGLRIAAAWIAAVATTMLALEIAPGG